MPIRPRPIAEVEPPVTEAVAGGIVAIAGIEDVFVGDTITSAEVGQAGGTPAHFVEQPTIKMRVGVNTSPLAGKSKKSKFLTSRHLRERLVKETRKNLALRMEETESPDTFVVYGRGEFGLAVLIETMRREGYEVQLGNPEVVTELKGEIVHEPVELVIIDVPIRSSVSSPSDSARAAGAW